MIATIFLRFPDQATFESLLPAGFEYAGETLDPLPGGVQAVSIIGAVYTGGTYDAQGNVIAAPMPVPGWHVNALGVVPDAWAAYVIVPLNPVRLFGSAA